MDCDDDHDKKIMVLDNDQVVQSPSEEDDVENSSEAVASHDDDVMRSVRKCI